ncbi:MAG: SPOR domain-containing protein [Campylobacterota bacterium]|nr:SPOR domain-containing protein [Campylobacterota bacterium]
MEEKNELNDIILNKGANTTYNKKIILAVATLGVVLIIVVMLMNTFTSNGTDNLPQAVLPPEPKTTYDLIPEEEALFEEIEVLEDESKNSDNLDNIAQKLKQESISEMETIEQVEVVAPKPVKKVVEKVTPQKAQRSNAVSAYYIQVGSFSKYAPNKKFLKSITDRGYSYTYHKVRRDGKALNKVLVGPFNTEKEAKNARINIRTHIEAGAFLIKL